MERHSDRVFAFASVEPAVSAVADQAIGGGAHDVRRVASAYSVGIAITEGADLERESPGEAGGADGCHEEVARVFLSSPARR